MPRLKPPSKEESQLLPPYAALPDAAIHIPAHAADFEVARTQLLQQTALGFDTESKPLFHIHQVDTGPHVVQLATPEAAWILQLHLPPALALAREIIGHAGICKVGFGLDNDKSTLPKRLGVELANIVDLDRRFQRYGYGASTGVRAAVAMVLGQSFHKSKKQSTSNWSLSHLSEAQIRYAANDAHAPAKVYAALSQWEAAQTAPAAERHPRTPRSSHPLAPVRASSAQPRTAQEEYPRRAALFQPPKKPSNSH